MELDVWVSPAQPRQWDLFEATVKLAIEPKNPFDPDEIDLQAEFVAPDGKSYVLPAFYYQRYERRLVGGREELTAAGEPEWRVRFSPPQKGSWSYSFSLRSTAESGSTSPETLTVVDPAPDRHGLLRVGSKDHTYLCFDDATPFFAVGENLAWYDKRGTFAYDDWLKKLAARGANYIRVWMPSWAFGLEWIERDAKGKVIGTSLGDYRARLGQAWQLDYVLKRARQAGIYVMLSIQNHGPFSKLFDSEWVDNPYGKAQGGPLARPEDFFTDKRARDLFKRRLRYLVARWAYSDAILAWELWNEVDNTEQRDLEVLEAWHKEMVAEMDRLDPFNHLLTTSVSLLGEALSIDDALYELPGIDLAQIHRYGNMMGTMTDFSQALPELVGLAAVHKKPVLLAEVGADYRGAKETVQSDPEGIAFHDILWAGLFSGSAGTGMAWFWDQAVDPQNWYVHFGPLAALVKGIVMHDEGFSLGKASASAAGHTLAAHVLLGKSTVLGWVKNAKHQWTTGSDKSLITGASLTVSGVPDGSWTAEWIDPYGKTTHPPSKTSVSQGKATLQVPSFSMDIALRMSRQS